MILAEKDHYDLAIRLATAFHISPAYALTVMMYRTKDEAELTRLIPSLPLPHVVELC
jgi:hypothetical protein